MKFNNNNYISDKAIIGNNVKIGDNTIIYDNVIIEDNTIIANNCVIGEPLNDYYFNENYENYENYLFSNGDIESKKMNAQVIEFSTIIEKKYNKFENYYAPLICLSNGEEYLIIDNKIKHRGLVQ